MFTYKDRFKVGGYKDDATKVVKLTMSNFTKISSYL